MKKSKEVDKNEKPPRLLKVLIVDYSLPGMNGLDLCSKVRREYKDSGITLPKVIMNSGISDPAIQKTAL